MWQFNFFPVLTYIFTIKYPTGIFIISLVFMKMVTYINHIKIFHFLIILRDYSNYIQSFIEIVFFIITSVHLKKF